MLIYFVISGLIAALFPASRTLSLVSVSLIFIDLICIVNDTQLMIGGSHKYALSPEDFKFAAINLYIVNIRLFMYILSIIGASKSS